MPVEGALARRVRSRVQRGSRAREVAKQLDFGDRVGASPSKSRSTKTLPPDTQPGKDLADGVVD